MSYMRWQANWQNGPSGATPIVNGFLNQVESTFVSQDSRLTTLETVAAVVTQTASYTATSSDHIILGNAGGGSIIITLPTAVGRSGIQYEIKRINSGANTVTLATTSSQTIDGAATQVLNNQYDSLTVVSDGANWFII